MRTLASIPLTYIYVGREQKYTIKQIQVWLTDLPQQAFTTLMKTKNNFYIYGHIYHIYSFVNRL